MLHAVHGNDEALDRMDYLRDMSADPDVETEWYYVQSLMSEIKTLLALEFGKNGVFTLAERWDCPLMWSHYADNHRGRCVEFNVPDDAFANHGKVDYERPRSIKIGELMSWKLGGCSEAARNIINTSFFAKAPDWEYEQEWRDIADSNGLHATPVRIIGIYFGLRCEEAVQTAVVKLFANAPMSFFDVYSHEETFGLKRRNVDTDEVEACGLRSSPLLDFDVIDEPRSSSA